MARDEILTYLEMCQRERLALQRGMNFFEPPGISIVLMSRRRNAPYTDKLSEDGTELIYEGHDVPRTAGADPKSMDQPWRSGSGAPTENAKFARATERPGEPVLVRVYEKLQQGIWSDKGLFQLSHFEYVRSGQRKVFKFHMRLADRDESGAPRYITSTARRLIPGEVKQEVYKRDKGQCVLCGARDNIHFDHDLPFSRGGTSITAENVRILCARHNLSKGAKISE